MTSLVKYISASLSDPITATPNALAFSSPSATQRAPPTFSPSNSKTLPPSPPPSMSDHGLSRKPKKQRFRGWVCEDEISEDDTALLEKLEAQGRDFSAPPLDSKNKSHAGNTESTPEVESPSSTAGGKFNFRQRTMAEPDFTELSPAKNLGQSAHPKRRQPRAYYSRKSQKKVSTTSTSTRNSTRGAASRKPASRRLPTIAQASQEFEGQQPPRKKPRFRGYVCEDEVEEDDPALADVIRQKGTLFSLSEGAGSRNSSTRASTEGEQEVQNDHTATENPRSKSPDAPSLQDQPSKSANAENPMTRHLRASRPKTNSGILKRRSKKRQTKPQSQHRARTAALGPLFPNLARDSQVAPIHTSPSPPKVPDKESTKATPLSRAQQLVATSTAELKHLTAAADQAAKAAAIAKRKAGDAANKLEEAKRLLRVESEKEKAKKEGRRYVSGWALIESEEDEQGWEKAGSGRRRNVDMKKVEEGGRLSVGHGDYSAELRQSGKTTNLGLLLGSGGKQEEDEDEEDDEDFHSDDIEDEDDDGDDDDDDDDDEDEGEVGPITDDDEDDNEFNDGDDEDGLSGSRTADLLG